MRKTLLFIAMLVMTLAVAAQKVSVQWSLADKENLASASISGEQQYTSLLQTSYLNGSAISKVETLTAPNAATGYEAQPYDPCFASFYVATKTSGRTAYHNVAMGVTPQAGHKFKPTKIAFDACKVGTDGGNFDVYVKESGGAEILVAQNISPLRNRVDAANPNGYSHHEFFVNDFIVDSKAFLVIIYIYNVNGVDNENPKSIALRNVTIEGAVDEEIYTAAHYVTSMTCKDAGGATIDLTSSVTPLRNGGSFRYATKLSADPTDIKVNTTAGYTAKVRYADKEAVVSIEENGVEVFTYTVQFVISTRPQKPAAKPLSRGLMAVNLASSRGTGNLVSWRMREKDPEGTSFKLYRGTSADSQTTALNGGNPIKGKSNFRDAAGNTSSYYRLEVLDADGNVVEETAPSKAWANQTMTIPLGDAPKDKDHGSVYHPNDASFCDMDGDGEYEVILKWSPENEKDAASSGTTSSPYFDCLKMDGTRLWRIRLGDNFFTSAHTIQFIAWDFDGDGYGEFMCKTAPGTVDGQGNYVLLGNDNPNENFLSSRGKQDHGPEYITVFDGTTGAELATIPYHTDYQTGASYWGDSNQNRSERYLAALAYLDGYDKNPSPIFARGYYSGAFVAAYDWDGETLTQRWLHRALSANNGEVIYANGTKKTLSKTVYGDGAHWISVGDCDGDGKQEIIYGSSCIDDDGTTLYRTGLGHGDALHLGDFITDRPGLEVLMCHEHKPYGIDIRDAKTGTIIHRQTEGGDTGRGLAAHFDSSRQSAQFLSSARAEMFNCDDLSVNGAKWAIGSSGAGINCRVYWDGDLYDEFYDKSIIAHWNPTSKNFDRYQVNGGNYTWGSLNNGSKNNPSILGDILGDWREEIITHDDNNLIINATSFESDYPVPHLMDDYQYRVQVVNQNVCYNQPPHLSYDPAVRYGDIKPEPTPDPEPVPEEEKKGDLAEGTYYIQNVETGNFILAGSSWGTRAITGPHGIDFKATLVGTNKYNLDSNISNGTASQFLSADENPFTDAPAADLRLIKVSDGVYTISNGTALLTVDETGATTYAATAAVAAAQWRFLTADQMKARLSAATADKPVDATYAIKDADFGRNNLRFNTAWGEVDLPSKGGNNENMNAEKWGGNSKTFTTQQTVSLPDGWYRLSCDGFYRYNNTEENTNSVAIAAHADGTEKIHSYLFANDASVALKSIADDTAATKLEALPFSQKEASTAFDLGLYDNSLLFELKGGTLRLGVKKIDHEGTDWTVFDNFELYYYGVDKPEDVDPDEPVVDPDEPVVDPDEPVVDPDEPVVDPDEPVVDPDEPVVDPDEPVVDPDEPVVDPDEPVVDAINRVTVGTDVSAYKVYTIHGSRITSITSKGLYIINGKKIFVR